MHMYKLYQTEEMRQITAFKDWKAQKCQERLAIKDEIEYQLEALVGWREIIKGRRSSMNLSGNKEY